MSYSLPKNLIERLQHIKGFDKDAFIAVHESGKQVTSIRLNPEKISLLKGEGPIVNSEAAKDNLPLSTANLFLEAVPWCPYGKYLSQRPSFTFDPHFHAGVYYVQEASSMFLWKMLEETVGKNTKGLKVLDLCAAPGGKSTLLCTYFKDGFVVANETIRSRANILAENITKWGAANVVVTSNDPKDIAKLQSYFNIIVVDAPCSGSGLFRKDNDAIEEWSEENVMLCNQRQQRILVDVYSSLKKDGILIYSTCSYSKEENEDICDWLLSNFELSTINCLSSAEQGIVEIISEQGAHGYRFYPYKIKGEGFFIAAFKKNNGEEIFFREQSIPAISKTESEFVKKFVPNSQEYFFFKQNENILAIPAEWKNEIALLQKYLYLRKAGINIGELKRNDLIPHHELAMSLIMHEDIPKVNVDKEQAIQYLQKKELHFTGMQTGWALVNYDGIDLGWIKVLPNRINNYYPTDWRILKNIPV